MKLKIKKKPYGITLFTMTDFAEKVIITLAVDGSLLFMGDSVGFESSAAPAEPVGERNNKNPQTDFIP